MAVDEMLLEAARPTLRVYGWSAPACTLGYFQSVKDAVRRGGFGAKKIPVVRRLTGGGLVKHGKDLTFSLCLKEPNPYFSAGAKTSYLKINEVLLSAFKEIHPRMDYADCKNLSSDRSAQDRVCFDSPACYDLMLDGRKVVGASQRRRRGVILHQSSVFLDIPHGEIAALIRSAFERKWAVNFREKPLERRELEESGKKERERYSSEDWAFPVLDSSFLR